MNRFLLVLAMPLALGCAAFAGPAAGEDLLQIYREAVANDPVLGAALSTWQAAQEAVPQARANLLPNVNLSGVANEQDFNENLHTDQGLGFHQRFPLAGYTISASQPLYRAQNRIALSQAEQQVGQSNYVLNSAKQDLIVRVTQAYLDVLLAQFNIELNDSQKAAVSENLAQAKRNFEVGVATITDTNDAQAKYDQIVAQEITARNDLDNKRAALRAIIGRNPGELKRFERSSQPTLSVPETADSWIAKAVEANLQVRIAKANFDIASLEVERQRAANYPTFDLVASFNQTYAGGAASTNLSANFASDTRTTLIGVQFALPLYQGGGIQSRVQQAVANLEVARQNLEAARRAAELAAQTAYTGVSGGAAQVSAFDQALKSAQVSYDSNKLGLEVGVRTNLDVLNQQQQVFQTRFSLAQSYYNYIMNDLRLKASVGTLTESDLEQINRRLGG